MPNISGPSEQPKLPQDFGQVGNAGGKKQSSGAQKTIDTYSSAAGDLAVRVDPSTTKSVGGGFGAKEIKGAAGSLKNNTPTIPKEGPAKQGKADKVPNKGSLMLRALLLEGTSLKGRIAPGGQGRDFPPFPKEI